MQWSIMLLFDTAETSQHGAARRFLASPGQQQLSCCEKFHQTGPQPPQVSSNCSPSIITTTDTARVIWSANVLTLCFVDCLFLFNLASHLPSPQCSRARSPLTLLLPVKKRACLFLSLAQVSVTHVLILDFSKHKNKKLNKKIDCENGHIQLWTACKWLMLLVLLTQDIYPRLWTWCSTGKQWHLCVQCWIHNYIYRTWI